jgi:hypothetical protein
MDPFLMEKLLPIFGKSFLRETLFFGTFCGFFSVRRKLFRLTSALDISTHFPLHTGFRSLRRIEKPIFDPLAVRQRRQKLLVEGQRIYLQERSDVVAGLARLRLPLDDESHEPVNHPAAECSQPTGSGLGCGLSSFNRGQMVQLQLLFEAK